MKRKETNETIIESYDYQTGPDAVSGKAETNATSDFCKE